MNNLSIAVLTGIGAMIGWGFSDFFSAAALQKNKISESLGTFLLYLITTIILWLALIITNQPFGNLDFNSFLQIIIFALLNVAAFTLFFKALKIGQLSIVSTLFSTYPIGASVISILFFAEATNILRIVALGIVIFGIIFISLRNLTTIKTPRGLKEVLLASILLAIFFPLFDQFLQFHPQSFFWSAMIDTIMTVILFINLKKNNKKNKIILNKNMILSGIFNSLGILAIAYGLQQTNLTSVVTVISGTVPLISVSLGYFIFKEKLTKLQYFGIAAILIGSFVLFAS